MKILWVCNVVPSYISKSIGLEVNTGGGWIDGLGAAMDSDPDIEFALCANYQQSDANIFKTKWGHGSVFYGFHKTEVRDYKYDDTLDN